jgi:uncharacterized Zn finger protein
MAAVRAIMRRDGLGGGSFVTVRREGYPYFDLDALRDLAGAKSFARGETYHRAGAVSLLDVGPQRVLAQVGGTETYRVALTGTGTEIGGECSCPAFENFGVCKHMVATALAANAVAEGEGGEAAEAIGARERIRDHLKARGVDALIEMILDLAERDPALHRRLALAAVAVKADDEMLEARLRTSIRDATGTRGYVDYQEAGDWAAGVETVLDAIADLVPAGRASVALKLVVQAIDCLEDSIEEIDDSDGHCSGLLEHAGDIHLAAARAGRPDPVELAADLFEREVNGAWGIFDGAVSSYADVLGSDGLAAYRRLATEAWAKLPRRILDRDGRVAAGGGDYRILQNMLDFFAAREGDVEARIALRTKDLSSPGSYVQLVEFCIAQGRKDEALRHAEEGLWLFEAGRADLRLVFLTVDLLVEAGREADAAARLWQVFEKGPTLELYTRLRRLDGTAMPERALTYLETWLVGQKGNAWNAPADLLVQILLQEKRVDAAWSAAVRHGASLRMRETLAEATEATHPQAALAVYVERVDELADSGGNPGYEQAAKLVARMAALQDDGAHKAYVAGLKARFGRRRNLMKLLG